MKMTVAELIAGLEALATQCKTEDRIVNPVWRNLAQSGQNTREIQEYDEKLRWLLCEATGMAIALRNFPKRPACIGELAPEGPLPLGK